MLGSQDCWALGLKVSFACSLLDHETDLMLGVQDHLVLGLRAGFACRLWDLVTTDLMLGVEGNWPSCLQKSFAWWESVLVSVLD